LRYCCGTLLPGRCGEWRRCHTSNWHTSTISISPANDIIQIVAVNENTQFVDDNQTTYNTLDCEHSQLSEVKAMLPLTNNDCGDLRSLNHPRSGQLTSSGFVPLSNRRQRVISPDDPSPSNDFLVGSFAMASSQNREFLTAMLSIAIDLVDNALAQSVDHDRPPRTNNPENSSRFHDSRQ